MMDYERHEVQGINGFMLQPVVDNHRQPFLPAAAPSENNYPTISFCPHQTSQVANLGMQTVSSALGRFSPAAQIPFKVTQGLLSTYSLFREGLSIPQKITHGLQAGLSFTQASLYILMLYKKETCSDTPPTEDLCISNTVLTLVYAGVLAASTAVSYLSSDSVTPTPQDPPVSSMDRPM